MDELWRQALDILRGMWRRRWIGLAVAWVVGAVGLAAIARMPERYEATARVFVDTSTLLKPLMSGLAVAPDVDQQVGMLARTLVTRPNIEKLVGQADLAATLPTPAAKEHLVDQIMREVRFSMTGRDGVYNVSYRDTDRARAQRVVQGLVSMFVESGLGNKRRDTEASRRFIDEQILEYEKRLQEAENRLKEFRLRNLSLVAMGGGVAGGQDHIARIAAAADELNRAQSELRVLERSRDALKRELEGELPMSLIPDSLATLPMVTPELEARIALQRRQLDDLLRRFTDQHPDVAQTQRTIASLEQQKREEMEASRRAAAASVKAKAPATNPVFQQIRISLTEAEATVAAQQARVADVQARLSQLRAAANQVPRIEAELAQLNRDYNVVLTSYQQLVSRREAAALTGEVDATAGLAEFRVIEPPRVADGPVFPSRAKLAPAMLLAALGAGLAAAFAVSQLWPTFQGVRRLRQLGQRPVLGALSLLPDAARIRRERAHTAGFAAATTGLVIVYGAWLVWLALLPRA